MKKIIKIAGIVVSIIFIGFIGIILFALYGSTNPPETIGVDDINVSDKSITLKGNVEPGSATVYRGNSVAYRNEALYIKIRFGSAIVPMLLSLPLKETSSFDISIDKNKYGKINKIYLQGNTRSEIIEIWPKNNKYVPPPYPPPANPSFVPSK